LDGAEAFLTRRVPELSLGLDLADFVDLEAEVHADSGEVILCKGALRLPSEQGGLSDATVARKDHLYQHFVTHGELTIKQL
jgi:hypothetical protein